MQVPGGWVARLACGFGLASLSIASCGGQDESLGMSEPSAAGSRSDAGQGAESDGLGGGMAGVGTAIGGIGAGIGSGGTDAGGEVNAAGSPPIEPGPGSVGSRCVAPSDCVAGLTCITETVTSLGGGAPPHGLCTLACASDQQCAQRSAGSLCYPFTAGSTAGYCVEGCAFGEPALGSSKCHDRNDFACNPALLGDTGEPCQSTSEDCQSGELCVDGRCNVVLAGCLPSCRGDIDCAVGRYCDQSFLSGVCVPQKPTGKALGEPCTLPSETEPAEPDECLGFCQADSAASTTGHCAATCGLLSECAWNSETGVFDGACFYASILTSETGFIGDFGFCTPACNCTEECHDAELACSLLDAGPLGLGFKGPGLCFAPDAQTEELDLCSSPGAGGAAGAGGAGGAPF